MDEARFIYQPYRSHRVLTPILQIANGFCILALGYAIAEKAWAGCFVLGGMVLISAGALCALRRQANALVFLDEKGITLTGDRKTACRHIPWAALSYGYQAPNFRNSRFLILSGDLLTDKQTKDLANRCSSRSQMYLDGCVCIHLDATQDTASLVDHVARHIGSPWRRIHT